MEHDHCRGSIPWAEEDHVLHYEEVVAEGDEEEDHEEVHGEEALVVELEHVGIDYMKLAVNVLFYTSVI